MRHTQKDNRMPRTATTVTGFDPNFTRICRGFTGLQLELPDCLANQLCPPSSSTITGVTSQPNNKQWSNFTLDAAHTPSLRAYLCSLLEAQLLLLPACYNSVQQHGSGPPCCQQSAVECDDVESHSGELRVHS